jgi:hypothetical protein
VLLQKRPWLARTLTWSEDLDVLWMLAVAIRYAARWPALSTGYGPVPGV